MQSLAVTENDRDHSLKRSQLEPLSDSKRSHVEHSYISEEGANISESPSVAPGMILTDDANDDIDLPPLIDDDIDDDIDDYDGNDWSSGNFRKTTSNETLLDAYRVWVKDGLICKLFDNSVTAIGEHRFSDSVGLTTVVIPDRIKTIGVMAFSGCTGITSVLIPNSVIIIFPAAFRDCTSLIEVVIPDSVITIGDYAFAGCTGLITVVLPDRAIIGDDAFPAGVRLILSSEVVIIHPLK